MATTSLPPPTPKSHQRETIEPSFCRLVRTESFSPTVASIPNTSPSAITQFVAGLCKQQKGGTYSYRIDLCMTIIGNHPCLPLALLTLDDEQTKPSQLIQACSLTEGSLTVYLSSPLHSFDKMLRYGLFIAHYRSHYLDLLGLQVDENIMIIFPVIILRMPHVTDDFQDLFLFSPWN